LPDEEFSLRPIGVIRSPYKTPQEAPYQGGLVENVCEVEVFPEFEEGLKDVEGCSHLILLYWLHKAERDKLIVYPPHDQKPHGVFATRSPHRPNPIGLCVAKLIERKGNVLRVKGLDAIDGTPLIDIKPFSPKLDFIPDAKIEWLEKAGKVEEKY